MNLEAVTLQDCIDLHQMKGYCTEINDGKVSGFREEGKEWGADQLRVAPGGRKETVVH